MDKKYKRKEFYTDSTLQFKFISIIITLVTVEAIIFGASIYFIFNYAKALPTEHKLIFVYLAVLVLLIGMAAVNTYIGIRSTHKIAGPLYKFSLIASMISRGNLTSLVNLRDNDLLQEFESDFNEMITNIRQFVVDDKLKKEEILTEVKSIKQKLDQPSLSPADIKYLNNSLDKVVENSSKIGANFILEEENEKTL